MTPPTPEIRCSSAMLRTFILALACHAVVGFQVAMRPAAMPLARAAAPTMLVELPTMLDVPTTLLAKSEADALLDTFFSSVFPLGTLAGIAVSGHHTTHTLIHPRGAKTRRHQTTHNLLRAVAEGRDPLAATQAPASSGDTSSCPVAALRPSELILVCGVCAVCREGAGGQHHRG